MKTRYLIAMFTILISLFTAQSWGRTWTSTDGREIDADFLRVDDSSVVVSVNGKEVKIPLSRLSKVDQKWIAAQTNKSPLVTAPTTPPENAITPAIPIENLQAFGFDALAKRLPTIVREFEEDTGDKFKMRGNAKGRSYINMPDGGTYSWRHLRYDDGVIEVEGKSISKDKSASWLLCITNGSLNPPRGIQISVPVSGDVLCSSSMWDKSGKRMKPIKLHRILRSTKETEFHRVSVMIKGDKVQVFFDGEPAGKEITLEYNLTPGGISLGGRGAGRFEFERLSYWKAGD